MNEPATATSNSPTTPRRRWRGWRIAGIGAAIAGVLGLAACQGGHHGHHWRHGAHVQMTPEAAAKRIDKAVNWVLDDVDATAAQKTQVSAIAQDALKDLLPLRAQHQAARDQAIELLAQERIDRDAIEQLRAGEIKLADQASRRLTQALGDIAEAITPAQRRQLAEQFRKRWG